MDQDIEQHGVSNLDSVENDKNSISAPPPKHEQLGSISPEGDGSPPGQKFYFLGVYLGFWY